jgi:glycosyltransferase
MRKTNTLKISDNFKKTEEIISIPIKESKLGFNPKVTIAIPTYKRTELLKEAIDSAINQHDISNYEIVVVDNDNTRNCATEKLIESYNEPRLRYYKNERNLGMVGNLNRIYSLAKGEYVVELHDDDLLYSDYLKIILQFIEANNDKYDGIFPPKQDMNLNYSTSKLQRNENEVLFEMHLKLKDLLWGNFLTVSGHIFRKQSFLEMGGYNDEYYPGEDYDFFSKFAHHYNCCVFFGMPLIIYRIYSNASAETNAILEQSKIVTKVKKNILSHIDGSKLYTQFWLRYNTENIVNVINWQKKCFQNFDNNLETEMSALGFKHNRLNALIRFTMLHYRNILFRIRRKRINQKL